MLIDDGELLISNGQHASMPEIDFRVKNQWCILVNFYCTNYMST